MTKRLVDVIMEVLDQLDATEGRPVHRSVFNPIIETRWKQLGHVLDVNEDFGQAISAELQRFCPEASQWKKARAKQPKLFMMHRDGYWSVRNDAPRGIAQLA